MKLSTVSAQTVRLVECLVVCFSDRLPNPTVRSLLQSVMFEPHMRFICSEDKFAELMADLTLHRLDVILADRPAPANPN